MVDIKKKRFNVIDPSTKADVELHHCTGNNLAGMAAALLDSRWVQIQSKRYDGSIPLAAKDIELQKLRREVLKKCVLAAHEADLSPQRNPFPEKSEMHKSHDLRYAFKLAGLSKTDCRAIISNFHGERFYDTLEKVFAAKS